METNTNFTTELKMGGESILTGDVDRIPTIFNRNTSLQIEKCSSRDCCGGLYHCPYCDPSVFKPTRATRTVDHIHLSHLPHAVYFKDLITLKCYQKCSKGGHYHCPVCSKLILKRINFRDHLLSHIRSENENTELVQTPNCRLPKKIELKDNNIELCEKACEDAVGKHYHCPVCKTRNFIDLGSTLSHVWRCSQQLKPKPRNSSHLVVTDNQQLSHPADCNQIKYHTSIVRSVSDIPVVRCQLEDCCGNKFHCQLCPVDKFKPNFYSHLLEHYNTHWKNRVEVDGYSSLICYLTCQSSTNGGRTRYHFHCPFCGLIRRQRLAMTVHVEGCERRGKVNKKQSESTSVVPVADQSLPEILEERKECMKNQETLVDEKIEDDALMEEEEEGIIDEPLDKLQTQVDDLEEKQQEKMSLSDENQEMENNVPTLVEEAEVSSPLISDNINPDNDDKEIINTLHQENKSTVDDVQNVKVFGTIFGLISERVQQLLCSDKDLLESCLNDIAKSSCTTLRWFTRDNRRLAALIGDVDSMVTAEKLFTSKILEKQPEEKILTHKEENLNIANQEETFSEILQSFLSSNLSKSPSKPSVSSPGTRKRGRPKKLEKVSYKEEGMKSMKAFQTSAIDVKNVSGKRYNTRGKRVKVYNTKDDDIEDGEEEEKEKKNNGNDATELNGHVRQMDDFKKNENFICNQNSDLDEDFVMDDSEADSDYEADGDMKKDKSLDENVQTSTVSTMTYLSESEEEEVICELKTDISGQKSMQDQKYSSMLIPQILIKKPMTPPENSNNKNKCQICDFRSSDFWELTSHIQTVHSVIPISCEVCEQFFSKKAKLLMHVESQHGPQQNSGKFVCEHCDKKYKTSKLLAWHLSYTHKLSSDNLVCKKCGYTGKSVLDLRKHRLSHKGSKTCDQCGKHFKYYCHLQTHMETVHQKSANHVCQFCEKVFHHIRYLKSHLKRHSGEKPHVCTICQAAFYETNSLKTHMETHKDVEDRKYRYICSYCGSKYNNKTNFEEHLNKHTGNKPYKCTQCDKAFGYKNLLNQHFRFTHSNEKPFQCKFCPKSFKVRVRLNQHMTTHTGLSNHTCPSCKRSFTCSTTLKKHSQKCKWADGTIPANSRLVVPKVEYIEDSGPQTQTVILDSSAAVYLSEMDLEQFVTEEVTTPQGEEEMFLCSECNMAFSTLEQAQEHIITAHA